MSRARYPPHVNAVTAPTIRQRTAARGHRLRLTLIVACSQDSRIRSPFNDLPREPDLLLGLSWALGPIPGGLGLLNDLGKRQILAHEGIDLDTVPMSLDLDSQNSAPCSWPSGRSIGLILPGITGTRVAHRPIPEP